jgi:hypothetical protein
LKSGAIRCSLDHPRGPPSHAPPGNPDLLPRGRPPRHGPFELVDEGDTIAGYYSLATGQVDFGDHPPGIVKGLPRRTLPVAVLAWLGSDASQQGRGLGQRLLAQAL